MFLWLIKLLNKSLICIIYVALPSLQHVPSFGQSSDFTPEQLDQIICFRLAFVALVVLSCGLRSQQLDIIVQKNL